MLVYADNQEQFMWWLTQIISNSSCVGYVVDETSQTAIVQVVMSVFVFTLKNNGVTL